MNKKEIDKRKKECQTIQKYLDYLKKKFPTEESKESKEWKKEMSSILNE